MQFWYFFETMGNILFSESYWKFICVRDCMHCTHLKCSVYVLGLKIQFSIFSFHLADTRRTMAIPKTSIGVVLIVCAFISGSLAQRWLNFLLKSSDTNPIFCEMNGGIGVPELLSIQKFLFVSSVDKQTNHLSLCHCSSQFELKVPSCALDSAILRTSTDNHNHSHTHENAAMAYTSSL